MWDQWLHSMAESGTTAPAEGLSGDTSSKNVTAWGQRLRGVLQVMEWWRWCLVSAGLICVVVGLVLLVQSSSADGVSPMVGSQDNTPLAISSSGVTNAFLLEDGTTAISAHTASPAATATSARMIYVDVSGAVVQPDLYAFEEGTRAGSAIAAAGGLTKTAHQLYLRKYFNGAAVLHDGQKLYIPFAGEELESVGSGLVTHGTTSQEAVDAAAVSPTTLISINTASSKELDTLPGIGPVRVEQIIAGRPYTRLEELEEKGILTASVYAGLVELIRL